MKAAFIERHGGPEVLKFGEMPDPVAASGEVVVDICVTPQLEITTLRP